MNFLKKILAYGEETCDFCGGTDWSEVTPGSGTPPFVDTVKIEWQCDDCGAEYDAEYHQISFDKHKGPPFRWIEDQLKIEEVSEKPETLKENSGTWFSLDKKKWESSDFFEKKFEEGKLKKGDTLFKYEARQEPKVKKRRKIT